MDCSYKTVWQRVIIATLTLPLLSSSCADIASRSVINGFYYATIPILNVQVEERVTNYLTEQQGS